jgi:hypothetical protein
LNANLDHALGSAAFRGRAVRTAVLAGGWRDALPLEQWQDRRYSGVRFDKLSTSGFNPTAC